VKKILALSILLTTAAHASPTCLTKSEARVHWPRTHLYWHGEDHCWDNHRGGRRYHQVKPFIQPTKPFIDKRAYIAQAEEAKPVAETKSDLWDSAQPLKVKLIEFIQPEEAAPVTSVERGDPLPSLTPPPRASLLAVLSGGFLAIGVSWFILTWRLANVKRGFIRTYQGTTAAGRKVLQACARKGNKQSPVPEINIRDIVRRANRAGHDPHLRALSASIANPKPTTTPSSVDDSAIACWARSLRT
jgi:hypothetical protein